MEIKSELLLRAICAYEFNGESNFALSNLSFFGTENTIRRNIEKIENELIDGKPYIVDITVNGMYSRYKINKVLECPEFIFEDFDLTYKCILLKLYNKIKELPEIPTISSISKITGMSYNTVKKYFKDTIYEDLKSYITPIKLDVKEAVEDSAYGLKYIGARKDIYKCQYCGTENIKEFSPNNHSSCRKCVYIRRRKTLNADMAKKLLNNSKHSYASRANIKGYDLDENYISELLKKQEGKCYYSKVPLEIGNKLTNPTLDRIDSNKGYIKGNVVICTEIMNTMKNNLTTEEFKNQIRLVYENMSNF